MTLPPRLFALLAFVVTFAAGAACMRAADMWWLQTRASEAPSGWTDVANTLRLSQAQLRTVDEVFARYQPSTDALLRSLSPQLTAISDSIHREIEASLTPVQRVQLNALRRPGPLVIKRKSLRGMRVDTVVR